MMIYFDKAGKENTDKTLDIAFTEAQKRSIKHIVVASTTGETGLKMAQLCKGSGIIPIIVTHNAGFKDFGVCEMKSEHAEGIKELGGVVLTGTMVLRNIGSAIKSKFGFSESELVNAVLRMFGQGMKVCVEMVAMVSDAGLLPAGDVITVAGTGWGADTAVIISPQSSNNFFDIKIKEILAKPKNF
jgi:hypothetical protein